MNSYVLIIKEYVPPKQNYGFIAVLHSDGRLILGWVSDVDMPTLYKLKGLYHRGRICNREKFYSFFKKDFRKPYPRFLYMRG